ncbi:MAG: RelA/SpoT domain-containing protein [Magnetococcus sp. DMHC-1]|nr:RelA/SpoT domain-containing protein [Magnetococcales bacterium]MBF0154091.1 RelA/SpoT domain-containing protein [Magnetococcales bacterium]
MEPVDDITIEKILDQYEERRTIYADFMNRQMTLLQEFLQEHGPKTYDIAGRVKERESLRRKLLDPDSKITKLDDVTDLVGIRIITYFEDEVELVAELIRKEFKINESYIVDRGELLDPERFGYRSRYYVVGLLDDRLRLIEYKRFKGFQAEIQVRSVLQQAWAELERELGYTSRELFPKERRRHFSRVASLLELADSELNGIKQFIRPYQLAQRSETRHTHISPDDSFDQVALTDFIQENGLVRDLDSSMATIFRTDTTFNETFILQLAENLGQLGIRHLTALENELRSHRKAMLGIGKQLRDRYADREYGSLWRGISILVMCYALASTSEKADQLLTHLDKTAFGMQLEKGIFHDDIERW